MNKLNLVNFQIEPAAYASWQKQSDELGLKYGDRLRQHIAYDLNLGVQEHRILALLEEVRESLEHISIMIEKGER